MVAFARDNKYLNQPWISWKETSLAIVEECAEKSLSFRRRHGRHQLGQRRPRDSHLPEGLSGQGLLTIGIYAC